MTSDPREFIERTLASFHGDQRMRNLFIWGAHTNRQPEPCESCGTPIVLIEHTNNTIWPETWTRWAEIVQDNGPDIVDLVFCNHDAGRCKSLRKRRGHDHR
jgi:hypothetical protein